MWVLRCLAQDLFPISQKSVILGQRELMNQTMQILFSLFWIQQFLFLIHVLWRVFLSTRASLLCGRILCPCQLGVHSILHSSRGEGEEVFAFWAIKDDEETEKSTAVVDFFFWVSYDVPAVYHCSPRRSVCLIWLSVQIGKWTLRLSGMTKVLKLGGGGTGFEPSCHWFWWL